MRGFLIIWLGELISMLGSGLTGFALGVWIYQETGLATPFAITVLLGTLPRILLSPIAGSLADRWNRRWIMILSDTGSALVTLLAFFLLQGDDLQIWMIYLISVLYSIFRRLPGAGLHRLHRHAGAQERPGARLWIGQPGTGPGNRYSPRSPPASCSSPSACAGSS